MKDSSFHNSNHLIGISHAVDLFEQSDLFQEIDNDTVLRLSQLGGAPGFSNTRSILKSTGIETRRLLSETVSPHDLACRLLQCLEADSGVAAGDFDQILLCHSHTDPTAADEMAHTLAMRVGLPESSVTGFNFGCSGYLKLMDEGVQLLVNKPAGSRVALLTVETPEFWHDAADRLFCGIVSAGATATILEAGRGLPVSAVRSDDFEVPAGRRPNPAPLFHRETADVFDFRGQPCRRTVMRMNAEPVFLNGIELMLDNLRSALLSLDVEEGQRVVVAPHQPSGKLLKALIAAASQEFPHLEFLNNLRGFGNTISSSVPTLVTRLPEVLAENGLDPITEGDHVVLLAAGICMDEIADHMSAGHACVHWKANALNVKPDFRESGIVHAA